MFGTFTTYSPIACGNPCFFEHYSKVAHFMAASLFGNSLDPYDLIVHISSGSNGSEL